MFHLRLSFIYTARRQRSLRRSRRVMRFALYLSVSFFEYSHKLIIICKAHHTPSCRRFRLSYHGFVQLRRRDVHMFKHFIPFDSITAAVRTKYRIRRILNIGIGTIAYLLYHFVRIRTRLIAAYSAYKPSLAPCIRRNLCTVIADFRHGRKSAYHSRITVDFGRRYSSAHSVNIRHCPTDRIRRHFKLERIPRFKQDAFCTHKPLAHRAICCLPEISALGMLNVSRAAD